MDDTMRVAELREHPLSGIVPDMRPEEWAVFLDDVALRGIVEPLTILADGMVLDGRHRLRAASELGLADVPVRIIELSADAAQEYMVKAALLRRHLSDDQRAVLARKWQAVNLNPGGRGTPKHEPSDTVSESSNDTRHQAVGMFSVPERKVRYAGELERNAPDLLADVERGDKTLLEAKRQLKERVRETTREHNRALVENTAPVHTAYTVYPTIVLDPPWDWGDEGDCDQFGRARPTYATMSIDEIATLPVGDLATPNAHLYLWITNRSLPKGFGLLTGWGFRYVTCLTWCKTASSLVYLCRTCYNTIYNTQGEHNNAIQGQAETSGICTGPISSDENSRHGYARAPSEGVRDVRGKLHSVPEGTAILQPGLRQQTSIRNKKGDSDREAFLELQGQDNAERLLADIPSGITDGESDGLCFGASSCDVSDRGQAIATSGDGSPQESGQGGQPARKPGIDQLSRTRTMPSYPASGMSPVRSCPRCGSPLQQFFTYGNPGLGNYYRGSTEHVLFGVRGSLGLLRSDVGTWFGAQRPGQHSAKPPDFYQMIETCSPGPWLEMFARQPRPGWATWGAEVV